MALQLTWHGWWAGGVPHAQACRSADTATSAAPATSAFPPCPVWPCVGYRAEPEPWIGWRW